MKSCFLDFSAIRGCSKTSAFGTATLN
jgi:hypothetical protein